MATEDNANPSDGWDAVRRAENRAQFQSLVEPYLDTLRRAARDDLAYYVDHSFIHDNDFTPEEIVGEALIYAWEHRDRRPDGMSLRGWLLGMQHRITRGLIEDAAAYRHERAISLDEQIAPSERERGFRARPVSGRSPQIATTWEDITPSRVPIDINAPLFTNRDTFTLDPDTRHVVMMHDEFEMPLSEVATAMQQSIEQTTEMLEEARMKLRQQEGTPSPSETPPPQDEEASPE